MRCLTCSLEYEVWPGWCPNCGSADWVPQSQPPAARPRRRPAAGGKKRVRSIGEDRVSTTVNRSSTTVDDIGVVVVTPVGDGR